MSFRNQLRQLVDTAELAAAIGSAVPVPPSAAAIGSAVGGAVPVPPSGNEIATATYNQGTKLVDAPIATQFTLTGAGASQSVDVSQVLSIDLSWYWTVKSAKAGYLFKYFARLRLEWLDSAGRLIWADAVELVNEGAGTAGAQSHIGILRAPATGTTLRITFEGCGHGQAISGVDTATVQLVRSNRTTDRFRYVGQPGYGTGVQPDDGVLLHDDVTGVGANAETNIFYAEVFDGQVDITCWANQAGRFRIWVASQAIVSVDGGTTDGLVYNVDVAASGFVRHQLLCPRSHVGISFANGATAGAHAQFLVTRGST